MWVGWLYGDGGQVELAAGRVDHRGEAAHVAQAAGSGFDVSDDAVQSLEDRVGAPVVDIREDVPPVTTDPAGEGLHGFRTGVHHPRAPCPEPGLGLHPARAGGVDVLEGPAHPAGASGPDPLFPQVMPGSPAGARSGPPRCAATGMSCA